MCHFFIAALVASAAAFANGQLGCQDNGAGVSAEAFGADFGKSDASVPVTKQVMSSLGSVAAVEAGKSNAPKAVQEAFLNSLNGSRGGGQTVRYVIASTANIFSPTLPHTFRLLQCPQSKPDHT